MTELNQNQLKGTAYENQILELLRRDKPAYLWKQAPETILIENGIIGSHNTARLKRKAELLNLADNTEILLENSLRDTGVDLIVMENETECALVQCKNGYKNGITMHDLAGFMCWMASMIDKRGYVYYTDKLSLNIQTLPKQDRIKYIREPFNPEFLPIGASAGDGTVISATEPEQQQVFIPDPAKLEYQTKARDLAVEYFRNRDNGVLAMPCGTGKTYTAFLIAQNFKQIVILSPLKQFAKQNLDRFVEYGFPRGNTLLVDSDGCRDVTRVREFITGNSAGGFLISATYDSADVISSILADLQNPAQTLFICDEFHNLSAANINDETDPINKILVADGFKKLFMSATPRIFELEADGESGDYVVGDIIYDMSFKYAIDSGFITDYRIWLPSIHEDISDLRLDISKEVSLKAVLGSENIIYSKAIYLFSCLVNTGVQKCIIYCTDTEEIRDLMETMTRLNTYYCLDLHMDKITAANSASSRTQILAGFASSSRIELLFSVRILDECIDIPSCDSIYITYPTKSKIRTIQRLMRCTRTLRSNKHKVGQVFIWCSEYDSILETLGGIKEIDSSFAEKVMINEVAQFRERGNSGARTEIKADCEAVKKLIIGVKEYRMVSWFEKLELLKAYLDTNKKRPSPKSKEPKTKYLGEWINTQYKNYKNHLSNMNDCKIRGIWDNFINHQNYKVYFLNYIENWRNTLAELKTYLDVNKKRPSKTSKIETIKTLGSWCSNQITKYGKKDKLMTDPDVYSAWTEFINHPNYSKYFIDNHTIWYNTLSELKTYLDENKVRPSTTSKDSATKALGSWCANQITKHKTKKDIMKNTSIYLAFSEFINHPNYSKYFLDNDSIWYATLSELKQYLDTHKKRPLQKGKNQTTKTLGIWLATQTNNYNKKVNNMSNPIIYSTWTKFINHPDYNNYFLDNVTIWYNNLSKLKNYLDSFQKRPSQHDKNDEIKTLGAWCSTQTININTRKSIMKNPHIFSEWINFVNNSQYSKYFLDNNKIWHNNLIELKAYLGENKKMPSTTSKDQKIKSLGLWRCTQIKNYCKKLYIMSEPDIYSTWTEFINHPDYKQYFIK